MRLRERIQWQVASGPPVTVGSLTITPQTRVLLVRLPFGAVVWNRPAAIIAGRAGQVERLSVPDVTRRLQVGLIGLGLLGVFAGALAGARRKETPR